MTRVSGVLVIGGAGYIGSQLVPQLLATGRRVTVMGRSDKPKYELPSGAQYVAGDFGQLKLLRDLLDSHQEVIHLADATVPNTSFENTLEDLLANLMPTNQLFLEVAKRGNKFVFVSSGGTVYGECIESPICENHSTRPISPYGVNKLVLESYANLYAATHGLKYICLRPGNPYGVGQQPFMGQGFIATAIGSCIQNMPVKIFGEFGTVRDYLYITDLVKGIICALESGQLLETYNIGSGVGLSNLQVIELLQPLIQEIGYELRVEKLPKRVFDVKMNVLDSTKLEIDTGWKPEIGFEDGLIITRDWLVNQLI